MARKERHVILNSERGGCDSKRENAGKASKHFKKNRMQWIGAQTKQNEKVLS